MANARTTKKAAKIGTRGAAKAGSRGAERWTLERAMRELEAAGSEQTRKTYLRHGAKPPMFGVSFAALKAMVKKIRVDHELALALFDTGNHDARRVGDLHGQHARVSAAELDRFAKELRGRACGGYASMLAAESGHGPARARAWLASRDEEMRRAGWALVGALANLDEDADDAWFLELVERVAATIHSAPNDEREAMNMALIALGGRSAALRKAALAAAKRIGKVEVDHGDTSCKTFDAAAYIEKAWAHAKAKQFDSPAAQERSREPMRTRC